MAERKTTRKLEAKTASTETVCPTERIIARAKLLDTLYTLALEGNVSAAKLYFDLAEKNLDDDDQLTNDAAMRLIHEAKSQAVAA